MFELPDAKRVRRDELFGASSDEESEYDEQAEAALRARLNAQLEGLLFTEEPVKHGSAADHDAHDGHPASGEPDEENAEEFEFRLFASTRSAPRVALDTAGDEAIGKDGGCFVARRPTAFYLAAGARGEEKLRYEFSAVTGEQVLEGRRRRCWGLELPWRVTRISMAGHNSAAVIREDTTPSKVKDDGPGKKRPGKKRRIALRVKEKIQKSTEEASRRQQLEKEEHLREKKQRLNREKKLKRRQKEREKKLADKGGSQIDNRSASPSSDVGLKSS